MYFEQKSSLVFINGEQYEVAECIEFAHLLCDQDEVASELLDLLTDNQQAQDLFPLLINKGYWYAL